MEKLKIVVYQRVSSDKQDYERQVEDIKRFCDYKQYEIVRSFSEKESGTIKERQELMAMMEFLKLNSSDISYVVVSELSRLGRTSFVLSTIEQLNNLQIGLISLKENITTLNEDKTVNATSTMIITVLSSINSYELDTMKFRFSSGKLNAVRNGGIISNKNYPYGYMKESELYMIENKGIQVSPDILKSMKKLVINPVEAEIVKQIFELSLEKGCRTIAGYLNNRGVPTRNNKKWRDVVVWQILTNKLYKGERRFHEHTFPCPQIISNNLFELVQTSLKTKSNLSSINQKFDYLLNRKLMICGICGKFYSPFHRPKKEGKAVEIVYRCASARYTGENCGNNGVNVNKIEDAVKNIIKIYYDDILMEQLQNTEFHESTLNNLNVEKKHTEDFISKQNKAEDNLIDLYTEGRINKAKFDEKLHVINVEKNKLKNQLVNINGQISSIKKIIADFNKDDFDEKLMDFVFTTKLIRSIVHKITIYPSETRYTTQKNEVVIRAEVNILNQIFNLTLSNRSPIVGVRLEKTIRKSTHIAYIDENGVEQIFHPLIRQIIVNSLNPNDRYPERY